MMYYTHLAFGLLVSLALSDFFNIENRILFVLIAALFSVFPDIDETKSKIGNKNKLISRIINLIFGHRGLFHTIYIPLILFLVFYSIKKEIGVAILAGYFSHLFIDALTKAGIKPFYPLLSKRVNGFFKTNSLPEKILFLVIIILNLYLLLDYI